ncbi:hypothetical protein SDC9_194384 [bioreactor metagenome]|uniref:Uncharacterized protein n=1 Tax=bioreactor metagenome TaxID=1076179 RepID=A0A645I7B0_9ZZZZ
MKQFLPRLQHIVEGSRHFAGESDEKQIALLEDRLKVFKVGRGGQQRGDGGRAFAHLVEEFRLAAGFAVVVKVFLIAD